MNTSLFMNYRIPLRMPSMNNIWVQSFEWSLLGYLILIIPAYLIIKTVRKSQFSAIGQDGPFYRMLACCVFGSDNKNVTTRPIFGCISGSTTKHVAFKFFICASGIQGSFLIWGILQEKIMTNKYGDPADGVRFVNSQFIVFMNAAAALLLSGIYILITGGNWSGAFYKFSFCSLSNIWSQWCQHEVLKYVSFPTQVLMKTSKMIPVMIMGRIISKTIYTYCEYFSAILISIGVSIFLFAEAGDKRPSAATTITGLLLMLGNMSSGSFTSTWQSHLFTETKVSPLQMMLNINVFTTLFTSLPLLLSGGMFNSILFIRSYPAFGTHVFIMSVASAIGQIFLYCTIAEFGPLAFTIIMVTRQVFSMLLSCIIYGHALSAQSIIGVNIVFAGLLLHIYAKYRIRVKRQLQQQEEMSTEEDSGMA